MSEYTPIDMKRNTTEALVIQPSDYRLQGSVEEHIYGLGLKDFDRLAIPEPSGLLLDGETPVMDWAKLLEGKHSFKTIYVMEAENPSLEEARTRELARTALKEAFPNLDIRQIEVALDEEAAVAAKALVITCADFRFQDAFAQMRTDHGIGDNFDLLAVPGGSEALKDEKVIKMVDNLHKAHGFREAVIFNHWDCAVFGGSQKHKGDNQGEADEHFGSQERATEKLEGVLGIEVRTELAGPDASIVREHLARAA